MRASHTLDRLFISEGEERSAASCLEEPTLGTASSPETPCVRRESWNGGKARKTPAERPTRFSRIEDVQTTAVRPMIFSEVVKAEASSTIGLTRHRSLQDGSGFTTMLFSRSSKEVQRSAREDRKAPAVRPTSFSEEVKQSAASSSVDLTRSRSLRDGSGFTTTFFSRCSEDVQRSARENSKAFAVRPKRFSEDFQRSTREDMETPAARPTIFSEDGQWPAASSPVGFTRNDGAPQDGSGFTTTCFPR